MIRAASVFLLALAATVYSVSGQLLDPSLDRAEEGGAQGAEFTYRAVDSENALDVGASTRAISNALCDDSITPTTEDPRGLSMFHVIFMQFLDHMTVLTDGDPQSNIDIPIPTGDPVFDPQSIGNQVMNLGGTKKGPGGDGLEPMPINFLTSYIDGSAVYGTTVERLNAMREHTGGRMRLEANNLPPLIGDSGFPVAADAGADPKDMFLVGDVRGSEHTGLTALHTLFIMEHNFWAASLSTLNPTWTDDQLFAGARNFNIAVLQNVAFYHGLAAMVGPANMPPAYSGFKPEVNSAVSNEFVSSIFRGGHSQLHGTILHINSIGFESDISMRTMFFRPSILLDDPEGIAPFPRGLAVQPALTVDRLLASDLRDFLFKPGATEEGDDPSVPPRGQDLAARNIQRGRNHRVARYNALRQAYGLPPIVSFAALLAQGGASGVSVATLNALYGDISFCDAFVCGLLEPAFNGGSQGQLFTAVYVDQFTRWRDGDRCVVRFLYFFRLSSLTQ